MNQDPIPAEGDATQSSSYAYADDSALAGPRYYYWLEAVAGGGSKALYGPVSATREVWRVYLPLLLRN